MKKASIIMVLVLLLCGGLLAGCSQKAESLVIELEENTYSEAALREDIARVKTDNVPFATDGVSDYAIVYPRVVDEVTTEDGAFLPRDRYKVELKNTALFLGETLEAAVGCKFPVVSDAAFLGGNAILLVEEDAESLTNQGYRLSIQKGEIKVAAKTLKGVCNGVYSFLEEKLGCLFLAADYDYVPKLQTINLDAGESVVNPSIAWRSVYGYVSERRNNEYRSDPNYLGWHTKLKLNGAGFDDWGNWCHTFYSYISPSEYFETHPEYFSEYGGKRKYEDGPVSGQLCLTNEDVYTIILGKLLTQMEENPDVHMWDVSQMDTWEKRGTGCRCKNCKALDDKEGGYMGSLLTFINRLADEVAVAYPNNFISTLAYNYSATPPKTLVPRENVIIKLCLMPGDSASGYQNPRSDAAKKAADVVTAWGKIATHIMLWDYNVDFHEYLMPYPILTPMEENNQFYIDNNVYGIFHQMDWDKGGDNAELNAYLFAKIMWDNNTDIAKAAAKYLAVYYGAAAPALSKYHNLIGENVYKANKDLYLYSKVSWHRQDYLSVANLNQYLALFEEAEEQVKDDAVLTARVKKAKIGVLYAKADQFSLDQKGRKKALEEFKTLCEANDIRYLYEGGKAGENHVVEFYNKEKTEINAIPAIIVAFVLLPFVVATLVFVLVRALKKRKRNKKAKQAGA